MTTPERTAADARGSSSASSAPAPLLALPRLARTAPVRSMVAMGRFDDAPGTSPANGTAAPTGRPMVSARDVIEHGLRVAQDVIDQQLESGERIMRHLRRAPNPRAGERGLDRASMATMTERSMLVSREVAVLMLEMVETLVEAPTVMRTLARLAGLDLPDVRPSAAAAPTSAAGSSRADPAACTVQVASSRPASGRAALLPGATLDDVSVDALLAPNAPPIERVSFVATERAFRVLVPDDHPPGVYAGAIVTAADRVPVGTLVVTVTDG